MYTLWEVLSGSVLVFADEDAQVLITWNESATFNVYRPTGSSGREFQEIDAFTNYNATSGTARWIAQEWFEENRHEF